MTGTMEEQKTVETEEMKNYEEAQSEEDKNQEIEDEETEDLLTFGDEEDWKCYVQYASLSEVYRLGDKASE